MFPLFHSPEGTPANYFNLQITVLKLLGISFTGDETRKYFVCSSLWLGSIVITYTVIELYEVYTYINDLDTVVNILSYLGTDILGVIKILVLLWYRIKIGTNLNDLEKGYFAPNIERGGPIEETLIKNCILICNRQTAIYYFSVIMVISLGGLGTLYQRLVTNDSDTWEMPFVPFSWFDVKKSPNYEIVWFYQVVWRLLFAMIVSSTDSLIGCTLAHMSTQCQILQNAIRRMVVNAYKDMYKIHGHVDEKQLQDIDPALISWTILQKHLKNIVDYHLAIINLAEQFEDLFSMLIFILFCATLFILCFIMYHASMFDLFSVRAAQDFSYVGLVMIQVFLYCFWGNEVTLQSQEVANACWETNFVGTDIRFQKGLALVIRRCQKPIVLTGGKFATLSVETYAWLIRASYSYYMVLRNENT